jgi:sugar lactone lactonase YvrE
MKHAMYFALVLAACNRKKPEENKEPPAPEKAPPPPVKPAPPLDITAEMKTPESALYDDEHDQYVITNINGGPADKDDNGTIVTVSPDGKTVKVWIDGASPDVKLDAPKGSAIAGAELWVADIDVIRRFDRATGKQAADIPIPGSTFLNDMVADGKGGAYVSDSGLDAKLEPTETDAVYHVDPDGKVTTVIKDRMLGKPNGLAIDEAGTLWVVTFGSGEMFSLDAAGKKSASQKLPKGQDDGLVALPHGEFLVSSWEGKVVFHGKPGAWKELVTGVESPADIGFDATRKLILIPLFTKNRLLGSKLPAE